MIALENIGKRFHTNWILKDISFEVKKGHSLVVLGLSGSGKTVLLKIIANLISPDLGKVTLATHNISMLFQKNALFDSLSVLDNLLFPLKEKKGLIGKPAHTRSMHLLKEVGLAESAHLFPNEISGGMQKRLGIARALVVEPQIILYDEPTAGLDPITSRSIADLIRKMQNETQNTSVIVTNDIHRAYQMGDQIGLLANQTFVLGGTPQETQKTKSLALKQFILGSKEGPLSSGLH